MELEDILQMDFGISQIQMAHTEFYEGIRALLVEKDKNPQWMHKSVHDITNDEIESFFDKPRQCLLDIN